MPRLERLTAAHAPALLEFERAEREWFARWVPDRGDPYFTAEGFAARHAALLAEQDAGVCRFHVLLDNDGHTVLGRFNLMDLVPGEDAEPGYRLARRATGRGLATSAVRELCVLARASLGLTRVWADTDTGNTASRALLARGIRPRRTGRPERKTRAAAYPFAVTSRPVARPGRSVVVPRRPSAVLDRHGASAGERCRHPPPPHAAAPPQAGSPAPPRPAPRPCRSGAPPAPRAGVLRSSPPPRAVRAGCSYPCPASRDAHRAPPRAPRTRLPAASCRTRPVSHPGLTPRHT
ncbi:GNAT family N-acetyltransferase [Streptomyces sp. SPB074]|uniref:GNAT family N-acetyltransferase n=1 Tax=Streptomyces sp. (strain SPB074) TaxID=465543 RepID=UPI0001D1E133|nr:GNAT family N-acetyltransferase [Streptomyces sp. SPB074]EFG65110.1 ribosomal-protein-alanine acetyltransferase [Streptomyces sp. SPB074]